MFTFIYFFSNAAQADLFEQTVIYMFDFFLLFLVLPISF